MYAARRLLLAGVLAMLAACGGAGGGTPWDTAAQPAPPGAVASAAPASPADGGPAASTPPPPPPSVPPGVPVLSASGIDGVLTLAWTPAGEASSYIVQKRSDDPGAWVDDGTPLGAGSLAAARKVAVADWSRVRFRVKACNAAGCTPSDEVRALAPLAASVRYLRAFDAESLDGFGSAIALSGDGTLLVVGAPGAAGPGGTLPRSGAVYVYRRTVQGWTEQAYLRAPDAAANDGFGSSLALSRDGRTLAVGMPLKDGTRDGFPMPDSGVVHVFVKDENAWLPQARLEAHNPDAADRFGSALALSADGGLLAVGAPGEDSELTGIGGTGADNFAPDSGAVYVFARSQGAWAPQAFIKSSNAFVMDWFGTSVALSDDGRTLAVGAPRQDGVDFQSRNGGAAYVFVREAGSWAQQAYLLAHNHGDDDALGGAIALSADGNTLAVGAVFEGSAETGTQGTGLDNSAPGSGAAYVFVRDAGAWTQQAYLKASNAERDDNFGAGLAISADGNTLAIGAVNEDGGDTGLNADGTDNTMPRSGGVYLFRRTGSAWAQQLYVKATNVGANDAFGSAIVLSAAGDTLAIAARGEDGPDDSVLGSGAVYLY